MIISRIVYTDNASETTSIPNIVIPADETGPDRVDPFIIIIIIEIFFSSPFFDDRDFRRYCRDRVQYRRTRILSSLSDEDRRDNNRRLKFNF